MNELVLAILAIVVIIDITRMFSTIMYKREDRHERNRDYDYE